MAENWWENDPLVQEAAPVPPPSGDPDEDHWWENDPLVEPEFTPRADVRFEGVDPDAVPIQDLYEGYDRATYGDRSATALGGEATEDWWSSDPLVEPEFAPVGPADSSAAETDLQSAASGGEPDTPAFNFARKMGERGAELVGNFVEFLDEASEKPAAWLEERIPLGGFTWGEGGAGGYTRNPEQMQRLLEETGADERDVFHIVGEWAKGHDFGYVEDTAWDDVKTAWDEGNPFGLMGTTASFVMEHGPAAMVDGVAALGLPQTYFLSRTEEIASERAANDGREEPGQEDYAIGAGTALVATLLERFGIKGAGIATGAAKEMGTEFVQESGEYTATHLGTERGATLGGAAEAGLQGAVLGGPVGAVTGGVQKYVSRDRTDVETGGISGDAEAAAINAATDGPNNMGAEVPSPEQGAGADPDLDAVGAAANAGETDGQVRGESAGPSPTDGFTAQAGDEDISEGGQAEQPQPGGGGPFDGGPETADSATADQAATGQAPGEDAGVGTEADGQTAQSDEVLAEKTALIDEALAAYEDIMPRVQNRGLNEGLARNLRKRELDGATTEDILDKLERVADGTEPGYSDARRKMARQVLERILGVEPAPVTPDTTVSADDMAYTPDEQPVGGEQYAGGEQLDLNFGERPAPRRPTPTLSASQRLKLRRENLDTVAQNARRLLKSRVAEGQQTLDRLEKAYRTRSKGLDGQSRERRSEWLKRRADIRREMKPLRRVVSDARDALEALNRLSVKKGDLRGRMQQLADAVARVSPKVSAELRKAKGENLDKALDLAAQQITLQAHEAGALSTRGVSRQAEKRAARQAAAQERAEREADVAYERARREADVSAEKEAGKARLKAARDRYRQRLEEERAKRASLKDRQKQKEARQKQRAADQKAERKEAKAERIKEKSRQRSEQKRRAEEVRPAAQPFEPGVLPDEAMIRGGSDIITRTSRAIRRKWPVLSRGARKGLVGWLKQHDIVDLYAKEFSPIQPLHGGKRVNPIRHLQNLYTSKSRRTRESLETADAILRQWRKLKPAERTDLHNVMHTATIREVYPDRSRDHPSNEHVGDKDWEIARLEYNLLTDRAKQLFTDVHRQNEKLFNDLVSANMVNAARALGVDARVIKGKTPQAIHASLTQARKNALAYEQGATQTKPVADSRTLKTLLDLAAPARTRGPYFPLRRFGQYIVEAENVTDYVVATYEDATADIAELRAENPTLQVSAPVQMDNGQWRFETNDRIVEFHESFADAEKTQKELKATGVYEVHAISEKDSYKPDNTSALGRAMLQVEGKLDDPRAQQALRSAFLDMLPDTSVLQARRHRRKVRGASRDFDRSFSVYAQSMANAKANAQHAQRIRHTFDQMRQQIKATKRAGTRRDVTDVEAILKELIRRDDMDASGLDSIWQRAASKISEVTFLWHLGSLSYSFINATQPWVVTYPLLSARHGPVRAFKAMTKAQAEFLGGGPDSTTDFMKELIDLVATGNPDFKLALTRMEKRGVITAAEAKMLDTVRWSGLLDIGFVEDLKQVGTATGGVVGTTWNASLNLARSLPQFVEFSNRFVSAIAGFRLEQELNAQQGMTTADANREATRYARDLVRDTQFDYSTTNKPRMFRYALARPMVAFQMYAHSIYGLFIRLANASLGRSDKMSPGEARKALAGLVGTHYVFAGMMGSVLSEPIRAVIAGGEWIAEAIGWDEEDEDDMLSLDQWLRQQSVEYIDDPFWRHLILEGPVNALGIDTASRIGLDSLFLLDVPDEQGREFAEKFVIDRLGPFANLSFNVFEVYKRLQDDQMGFWRAIEPILPKFFKDISKASRYGEEGVTSLSGTEYLAAEDIPRWQRVIQATGMAPAQVNRAYERINTARSLPRKIKNEKRLLMARWRRAVADGDFDLEMKIEDAIDKFNGLYPELEITTDSLWRSKERQEKAGDQGGVGLTENEEFLLERLGVREY